jgi:raffinose/stachyose/melibiose transport system permease protein
MPTKSLNIKKLILSIVMLLVALLWMLPFIQMISQSLKVGGIKNYFYVLTNPTVSYWRVILNTFFVSTISTLIIVIIASLGAYAFSKLELKGKNVIYYALLACLTLPEVAVLSPMFYTIKSLHLLNSYFALIFPIVAFQSPFILMLMRNYFDSIPDSILEASSIEGCSTLKTYFYLILPLGIPAIVNGIVLAFVNSWNEFLLPLIFVQDYKHYTVTLTTQFYMSAQNQTPQMVAELYAALMLMIIPSIILYLFTQKYMQEGLTAGAEKM